MAMVTLPPQALRSYQWLCHSDRFGLDPAQSIQASVLYLFADPTLGGTSFYAPRRPLDETARLFADAVALDGAAFTARYGIAPGYMLDSNDWFARTGRVAAKFNRMVFYDGAILHSGDIAQPQRLSTDRAPAG